jgi:hypothetical protein
MSELVQQLTTLLEVSEKLCKERGKWIEAEPNENGIVLDGKTDQYIDSGRSVVIGRRKVKEIIAALSAKEDPLRWTYKTPTEEGWYWYHDIGNLICDVMPLTKFDEGIVYYEKEKDKYTLASELSGKWAGPIPEPIDPQPQAT